MTEQTPVHTFRHYRIFEKNAFSCACALLVFFFRNKLKVLLGTGMFFYAGIAVTALLLFLAGSFIAAVLPVFRKTGSWYLENDSVVICPEADERRYVVSELEELYFSDPLMAGYLLRKKCVLELKTSNYRLLLMSLPMKTHASRSESELWPLFTEIRNRNFGLKRIHDTQGQMVDYWYRKEQQSVQKKFIDKYYSEHLKKYRDRANQR